MLSFREYVLEKAIEKQQDLSAICEKTEIYRLNIMGTNKKYPGFRVLHDISPAYNAFYSFKSWSADFTIIS